MGVIRFVFNALCVNVVFIAMLILMAGEIWVLRIVMKWLFDKDLMDEVNKWLR